jgi:hypothetical protein
MSTRPDPTQALDGRRRHPHGAGKEPMMKEKELALSLEVEEIENRERAGGCYTSSTTSRLCTCPCHITTQRQVTEK